SRASVLIRDRVIAVRLFSSYLAGHTTELPSFPTRRSSDLERRMPPALLLGQDVHLTLKLRVRRDAPRLRQHHPPLHFLLLDAAEQEPHVVPRLPLIQQLAEHLHPRHHHLLVRPKPPHLHFLPPLHLPPP